MLRNFEISKGLFRGGPSTLGLQGKGLGAPNLGVGLGEPKQLVVVGLVELLPALPKQQQVCKWFVSLAVVSMRICDLYALCFWLGLWMEKLSSIPPPPCISYALVQATVGVGTILIWYFHVSNTFLRLHAFGNMGGD